jgi:hypothetical protein
MSADTPAGLPLDTLAAFCRRYGVRELSLFGSALGDDFRADSDYDFLVEFEPEARITFITLSQMEQELQALLGRPVDLVSKRGLNPRIRDAVLGSARVLYSA